MIYSDPKGSFGGGVAVYFCIQNKIETAMHARVHSHVHVSQVHVSQVHASDVHASHVHASHTHAQQGSRRRVDRRPDETDKQERCCHGGGGNERSGVEVPLEGTEVVTNK